jgi:hypothetical protein
VTILKKGNGTDGEIYGDRSRVARVFLVQHTKKWKISRMTTKHTCWA